MSLSQTKARASDYEVGQFRQTMNLVLQYDRAANTSPYNSVQQQQNQYEALAEQIITGPNAMAGYYASQIEAILREFDQANNSAPYNSVIKKAYDVARQSAASGLLKQAVYELQSTQNADETIQICVDADTKFNNAAYNSVIKATFQAISTQGWAIAGQKIQQDANRIQDFRQVEALFVTYQSNFNSAPYNSLRKQYYSDGSDVLSKRELDLFRNQIYQLGYGDLSAIVTEYDNKSNQAPYNSAAKTLYAAIRDTARNRLSGMRPPLPAPPAPPPFQPAPPPPFQPAPPPPFQPAPPPPPFQPGPPQGGPNLCSIRQGTGPFAQSIFRVIAPSGQMFGPFFSYQQAQNVADREPQCHGFGPRRF